LNLQNLILFINQCLHDLVHKGSFGHWPRSLSFFIPLWVIRTCHRIFNFQVLGYFVAVL
jgi:hypothetical protein